VGAVGVGITIVGVGGGAGLLPIVLFNSNFYTDSICHKPVQILGSIDTYGSQNQHQQQFSVRDGATHLERYPFIDEFSQLIADLPTKELLSLMTNQQKALAKSIWEAENYGGDTEKAKKRLSETHGPQWFKSIRFKDYFYPIREYYELVLILEHQRQWDDHKKAAKLNQDNVL